MKLIFTDDIDVVRRYINGKTTRPGDMFVCWHWDIAKFLEQYKVKYTLIDVVLSSEDCKYIDKMAGEFAKRWFTFRGKDFSIYRGISLGSLCEYRSLDYFVREIKFVVASLNLIEKFNPAMIVDAYPKHFSQSSLLARISDEMSLGIEHVGSQTGQGHRISPSIHNSSVDISRRFYREVLSSKLKDIFLWGCRNFVELWNLFVQERRVPTVLFSCYRNEKLILQKWLKEKKRKFGICIDPYAPPHASLLVRLVLLGALILPKRESSFPWKAEELSNIKQLWGQEKGEEDYKAMFRIKGISIFNEILSYLDEIVSSDFSKSAIQIDTLIDYLRKYNVKLVVVYDDEVQRQRTLVDTANENEIKTLLIQHGLDADPNIPDKLRARFLALWASYDRETSIKEGVPPERIFVTGNPYFDDLKDKIVPKKSERKHRQENCKILVITYPENRKSAFREKCFPENYITTVLDAIRNLNFKTEVKVKLHPAEFLKYYNEVIGDISNENIVILKGGDLPEMLWWSDIVILPDSTVVFESNIMGCHIISLNLSKRPFVPPVDGSTEILSVTDSTSLAEGLSHLWNEIKNEKKERNAPLYHIDRYMGEVDGNSTERVYNLIEKLSLSCNQKIDE